MAISMLASPALPLAAQQPSDSALMHALSSLRPGDIIRVAVNGARRSGAYRATRRDTLLVGLRNQSPMALRLGAVDTLWLGRSAAGRGARIGAVSGAVLGGFGGLVLAGLAGAEGGSQQRVEAAHIGVAFLGAVVGAAGGGIIGAGIAAPFRRWKRVFP
jgi:hypothetical protein